LAVFLSLSVVSFVRASLTDPGFLKINMEILNDPSNPASLRNASIELSGDCQWKSKPNSKKS